MSELDDVSLGHGVSLLQWRSGGVEHPHDTPPYPFTPSPTSAHSSYALRLDQTTESHVPLGSPHAFHLHPEIADLIRKLRSSQRALCEEIALVPATFNPFRDLMMNENPSKVAALFLRKYNTLHRDYEFYQHTLERLSWKVPAAEFQMLQKKYAL